MFNVEKDDYKVRMIFDMNEMDFDVFNQNFKTGFDFNGAVITVANGKTTMFDTVIYTKKDGIERVFTEQASSGDNEFRKGRNVLIQALYDIAVCGIDYDDKDIDVLFTIYPFDGEDFENLRENK